MKTKLIAVFLMLSMAVSLSGCFPSVKQGVSNRNHEKITFEALSDIPGHISQQPYKNFTIDADVNVKIKNNFSIYTSKTPKLDFDKWCGIFAKDKKVTETSDEMGVLSKTFDNGAAAKMAEEPLGQSSLSYTSKSADEKAIDWIYDRYCSREIKNIFKKTEEKPLDFMSIEEAQALADGIFKSMGLEPEDYIVYSVDYDFLTAYDKEQIADAEEFGKDTSSIVTHTKDDEFYAVLPVINLPNESEIIKTEYKLKLKKDNYQPVKSNLSYALIGKDGVLSCKLSGHYEVTGETPDTNEVVSLNDALKTLNDEYGGKELLIYDIELTYVPHLTDEKQGAYELKPTWVFYSESKISDNYFNRYVVLVDAVSGNKVKTEE